MLHYKFELYIGLQNLQCSLWFLYPGLRFCLTLPSDWHECLVSIIDTKIFSYKCTQCSCNAKIHLAAFHFKIINDKKWKGRYVKTEFSFTAKWRKPKEVKKRAGQQLPVSRLPLASKYPQRSIPKIKLRTRIGIKKTGDPPRMTNEKKT